MLQPAAQRAARTIPPLEKKWREKKRIHGRAKTGREVIHSECTEYTINMGTFNTRQLRQTIYTDKTYSTQQFRDSRTSEMAWIQIQVYGGHNRLDGTDAEEVGHG